MLRPAVYDNLIDVAMEGFTRQVDELVHAFQVVEDLVGVLSQLSITRVKVCKNTSAAGVQPVPGIFFAVAFGETFGDGIGGVDVVGCIGCVYVLSARPGFGNQVLQCA